MALQRVTGVMPESDPPDERSSPRRWLTPEVGIIATSIGALAAVIGVGIAAYALLSEDPSGMEPSAPPAATGTADFADGSSTDPESCGWGPDRRLFSDAHRPDYGLLNSVIDNSAVGDERNFLVVKKSSITSEARWKDRLHVSDGGEYLLRVYARNDGSGDATGPAGAIHGATASVNLPKNSATNHCVTAFLDGDNQERLWDSVQLIAETAFVLRFLDARLYSNEHPDPGIALSTDLLTADGVTLGSGSPDKLLRPGSADEIYITLLVRVEYQ